MSLFIISVPVIGITSCKDGDEPNPKKISKHLIQDITEGCVFDLYLVKESLVGTETSKRHM